MPDDQVQRFHHTVAQLLFLCMISRPDIQPLVDFLTMGLRSPDEYDWGQLKRGLKYLKDTLYMKMYLRANYLNMIHWWFDDSYGTQWDCNSNTREVM